MAARGVILATALASLAGIASSTPNAPKSAQPSWVEVKWPFLLDQWGTGRAFACSSTDCGTDVKVYLRPKVGFCDCTRGVADDAEVDRVQDVDLLGPQFTPAAAGAPVTVNLMHGRSRQYLVEGAYAAQKTALAVALNEKCDVLVATVVGGRELPAAAERAAFEFLNGDVVRRYAQASFGLQ